MIGITNTDISMTKMYQGEIKEPIAKYTDWGVFGLGYRPGPSCIVSTFRLEGRQDRLLKIVLHELGHNTGLSHCINKYCLMTDAEESIKTIDFANLRLCSSCRHALAHFN